MFYCMQRIVRENYLSEEKGRERGVTDEVNEVELPNFRRYRIIIVVIVKESYEKRYGCIVVTIKRTESLH